MKHFNVEVKVLVSSLDNIRKILHNSGAKFVGVDFQTDVYFRVRYGRLKLRSGNIENALIYYDRENIAGPKNADILLQKLSSGHNLLEILTKSLGVLTEVKKEREIYLLDQAKIHLDQVQDLGKFVEIEVISDENNPDHEKTQRAKCHDLMGLLELRSKDMVSGSYSDMLAREK